MNYTHRYANIDLDEFEVQRYYTLSSGLSYSFQQHRLLGNIQVAIGIDNLLDRDPPLFPNGYDQSQISRPDGRFVFVTLKRSL